MIQNTFLQQHAVRLFTLVMSQSTGLRKLRGSRSKLISHPSLEIASLRSKQTLWQFLLVNQEKQRILQPLSDIVPERRKKYYRLLMQQRAPFRVKVIILYQYWPVWKLELHPQKRSLVSFLFCLHYQSKQLLTYKKFQKKSKKIYTLIS